MTINIKAPKVSREITIAKPSVLTHTTVEALVEAIGEDAVVAAVNAKATTAFVNHIKGKLEAKVKIKDEATGKLVETEEFTNSDEDITAIDYSEWKPGREVKSVMDKIAELAPQLSEDEMKALLAKFGA